MTHEEQKARIRGLFDRWRNVLSLDEWEVTLEYTNGAFIKRDGVSSGKAMAVTFTDWEYRRSTIQWNTDITDCQDDDELEYALVHEAMHVLLNGQRALRERSEGGDAYRAYESLFEEHTATTLARAFIRAKEMT